MIYYGTDCFSAENGITAKVEAGSVRLVLCDPPYNITANVWDQREFDVDRLFRILDVVCDPGATVVFFSLGRLTARLVESSAWSRFWRYNLVWAKNNGSTQYHANRMPIRNHEDIVVFYKVAKAKTYNPQMDAPRVKPVPESATQRRWTHGTHGASYSGKDVPKERRVERERADPQHRYPQSVLPFDIVPPGARRHPCEKPRALIEFLVKSYSNEGDLVLDPCAGCGVVDEVCEALGRRCVAFEKDGRDNQSVASTSSSNRSSTQ